MTGSVADPHLRELIDRHVGGRGSNLTEVDGEQGASGAQIRYVTANRAGAPRRLVVKNATEVERRVVHLLQSQGQAVPRCSCQPDTPGRDWLVMDYADDIPYGDSALGAWPARLGIALGQIHATNRGRRPEWLPPLPSDDALHAVYADGWIDLYDELIATNSEFRSRYGPLEESLRLSWRDFGTAFDAELRSPEQHTLISTDLTPSHWRQRSGQPVLIDWEQARFGPLYLDLPNVFDHTTVKHYYRALVDRGVSIPALEFAEKFSALSRYLGFRYLSVGLEFWLGTNRLGRDYWDTVGARFFDTCLHLAQFGYPRPDLVG